jgi:hypothetical protein
LIISTLTTISTFNYDITKRISKTAHIPSFCSA